MDMLSFEEMYAALVEKKSSFEGIFFVGVKTTGIFCRPTCTARKPKPENVEFFGNAKLALANGYRPCKICKPMEASGAAPVDIQKILKELSDAPHVRIKDRHLRQKGLDPAAVRRWFLKHHHMTFHAYQRALRLNGAFELIKSGARVTAAAFDSGYDSVSGFNEGYKSIFGAPPGVTAHKTVVNLTKITTPLGPMYGCATGEGVCMLEFTDRKAAETEFKELCTLLNGVILPGENGILRRLRSEVEEYFNGSRKEFSVPLCAPGTAFQRAVWAELRNIPYGETRSYKRQAAALGKPSAVRAVGAANGHNRISIIIPCHRVIGEDGGLTGYGGGLPRKKWLLEFEKGNR